MLSSRAIVRLSFLALLVIGAGCSSSKGHPCATCDAAISDRPSVPADDALSTDPAPNPDPESETEDAEQILTLDARPEIDLTEPSPLDGLDEVDGPADAPATDAAWPTPVPDGGALLFTDFEDGTADGWRSVDSNDAGAPDNDWSVFLGDSGSVYSEGSLDTKEWHISFASSDAVADQIVEAKMRVVEFYDSSPSYVAALFARYDPSTDSGYFVALRGDGAVIIRKRVRGTSASWAAGVDAGIVPGSWYMVRLEVLGNTANAFLDGQLVYSVVDSDPLAAGTAALGTYGATLEVHSILLAQP